MKTNLSQPPIEEKVRRFYDIGSPYYVNIFGKHIHDGYYITGKESREEAQENLVKLLVEKAEIKNGSRILDVGCGIGGSSVWLAQHLDAVTVGITISPVQLKIAQKLAREQKSNSSFLLMNAEEMDFAKPFDIIWVMAALTHFSDQRNFLESASRFLKKGGRLVIYDWTVNNDIAETNHDPDVQRVIEGMVLANLYSNDTYLKWLIEDGYCLIYDADITGQTIHTWDINASLIKGALIRNALAAITRNEFKEINTFLKGRRAIKQAMLKGKVRSTAIVAEKV